MDQGEPPYSISPPIRSLRPSAFNFFHVPSLVRLRVGEAPALIAPCSFNAESYATLVPLTCRATALAAPEISLRTYCYLMDLPPSATYISLWHGSREAISCWSTAYGTDATHHALVTLSCSTSQITHCPVSPNIALTTWQAWTVVPPQLAGPKTPIPGLTSNG